MGGVPDHGWGMTETERRWRRDGPGAFPDGESALNLAAARLRHIAGSEWSTKRYLSMEFLTGQQASPKTAGARAGRRSAKIESAKETGHYRSGARSGTSAARLPSPVLHGERARPRVSQAPTDLVVASRLIPSRLSAAIQYLCCKSAEPVGTMCDLPDSQG